MLESCGQPKVFEITKGNSKLLKMKAIYSGSFDPLDLTDCTEIDIALPNQDGTFTHLLLSEDQVEIVGNPLLGKFQAQVTTEVSEVLNEGSLQDINVTFTINDEPDTLKYPKSLTVFAAS